MALYFNINYELSPEQALERIDRQIRSGNPDYVCVADGNILQMVHNDQEYREIVNDGLFSICDSSWVPLFLKRIYGLKVPQYCGSQIFEDIVKSGRYKMFFLGTSDEILIPLRNNLAGRYDARIAQMQFVSLPFREAEEFDYPAIAEMINSEAPDIIWVALGAPKQERFMKYLTPYLSRGVQIAVGAVFKFYCGKAEKRAPKWMVRCHLEFLYRIFQDPKKQLMRCHNILVSLPFIIIGELRRKRNNR